MVQLHVPVIKAQTQEEKTLIHFLESLQQPERLFVGSILRKETRSSGAHRWVRSLQGANGSVCAAPPLTQPGTLDPTGPKKSTGSAHINPLL